jgi:hypothetical protein
MIYKHACALGCEGLCRSGSSTCLACSPSSRPTCDASAKRANARIEELQAQSGGEEQQQQGGFLDSMRDAVLGRHDPRGSVPNVGTQARQTSSAAPYQSRAGYPQQPYPAGPGMGPAFGSGGSFLGTAASTAAGVIGGGLLLNSIRSMFGDHAGLAHATGIDAIGRGGAAERQRDQDQDQDQDQDDQHQADQDQADRDQDQDQDQDDDDGDFGGDDTDA